MNWRCWFGRHEWRDDKPEVIEFHGIHEILPRQLDAIYAQHWQYCLRCGKWRRV